jgi:hypothetical protein|tara:strand:- start:68 stop:547 length:480 start_codon:yes stop_codon:yes gene_type:complete
MFGRKAKLEKIKATARKDYLKCGAFGQLDKLERLFVARIAQRSRLNLDKIFVQGAKDEEAYQLALINALRSDKLEVAAKKEVHDGFNLLKGTSGTIMSWVPDEYATQIYTLGGEYQNQSKGKHEVLAEADQIAEKVIDDLQTTQSIQLLQLLREDEDAG